MASLNTTPGGKYDLGRTPCVGETLRRTLKHLFFRLGFAVADETTLPSRELARGRTSHRRAYLVKDLYEMFRFRWTERRRTIGRLFSPQCCVNDEGDELSFDPGFRDVLGSSGREIWRGFLLVSGSCSRRGGGLGLTLGDLGYG